MNEPGFTVMFLGLLPVALAVGVFVGSYVAARVVFRRTKN
jgi:uncharacterized protein YneF (UPF0154 family)